jgi:hypothetical protein
VTVGEAMTALLAGVAVDEAMTVMTGGVAVDEAMTTMAVGGGAPEGPHAASAIRARSIVVTIAGMVNGLFMGLPPFQQGLGYRVRETPGTLYHKEAAASNPSFWG